MKLLVVYSEKEVMAGCGYPTMLLSKKENIEGGHSWVRGKLIVVCHLCQYLQSS